MTQVARAGLAFVMGVVPACMSPAASTGPKAQGTPTAVSPVEGGNTLPETTKEGTPYVWKSVPILGGGFVTGIIFSPAKAGVIFARTDIGGAYRYDGADKHWIPLTDHFGRADSNYYGIESIAPDPVDTSKVYAAVGMYSQSWAGQGAVLRSKDQGNTWDVTPMPIKMGGNEDGRSNGERLAVDPNLTSILLFGSRRNGLWKSADQGKSFSAVGSFPVKEDPNGLGIPFVVFDKASGRPGKATPVIYAGISRAEQNLYRSTDGGGTWQLVPGQPAKLMPSHAAFDAKGILYISYGNRPGPSDVTDGAVWKLDPKKSTWTNITPLVPSESDKFGYGGLAVDWLKPGTLMVSSIDRWTKKDEVFRSTDSGKSWRQLVKDAAWDVMGAGYLLHHKERLEAPHWTGDIDIDPFDSNRATLVSGAGLFMTQDAGQADSREPTHWSFRDQNLEETAVIRLSSPPAGPPLVSGVGDICGFRHDDLDKPSPAAFDPPCNGTTGLDFAQLNPEIFVRVGNVWGQGKHGSISNDGAKTWTAFASEPKNGDRGGLVAISADGTTIVWSPREAPVVFSRDRGATWTPSQGLPENAKLPDWVQTNLRPAADRVNPMKFYLLDVQNGKVFVSTNGAKNFQETSKNLPALPDWQMSSGSIQAVPGAEGDIWTTGGKEIYRSTDSGLTFSTLSTVEESYGLGFGKAREGQTYPSAYLIGKVNGTTGFFRSDDIGKTWVRINDHLHQYASPTLIIGDPRRFGRVYLGTGGRGILYGEPRTNR